MNWGKGLPGAVTGVDSRVRSSTKISAVVALMACLAGTCLAGETATLRNGFTIHYERRESVGESTRLYLSDSPDSFVDVPTGDIVQIEVDKVPAASTPAAKPPNVVHHPIRLDEALSAASQKHSVSPDLLRSVIRAESGFNANARSVKGAQGLMQLMPATAAKLGVRDAFDPAQNVDGGARYLHELLGRYNNNLTFALAAYNAGPERVEKYHGVPPFPETISYVNRVLRNLDENQNGWSQRSFSGGRGIDHEAKKSSAPNFESIRELQSNILVEAKEPEAAPSTDSN